MSEDIYSQFLRFSLDESAATTFTAGDAILTGAKFSRIEGDSLALEVHAISLTCSMPEDLPATGASEYVDFALSTKEGLTSMPNVNEDHVIYRNRLEIAAGVATYLPLLAFEDRFMPHYINFDKPLLISHAKIYPYIVSTNSSAASWVRGWLLYTFVLLDQGLALEALEAFR